MQRMQLAIGTRAEVLAELDQLGMDATQAGKTEKAEVFAEAWREVMGGDRVVVARHTRYEITDWRSSQGELNMTITDADRTQSGESCVTGAGPDAALCEVRITWHVPEGHVAHPPESFERRGEIGEALLRAHEILGEARRRNPLDRQADMEVTVEAVHVRRPGEAWYKVG